MLIVGDLERSVEAAHPQHAKFVVDNTLQRPSGNNHSTSVPTP